jgi:hypothetical protein
MGLVAAQPAHQGALRRRRFGRDEVRTDNRSTKEPPNAIAKRDDHNSKQERRDDEQRDSEVFVMRFNVLPCSHDEVSVDCVITE